MVKRCFLSSSFVAVWKDPPTGIPIAATSQSLNRAAVRVVTAGSAQRDQLSETDVTAEFSTLIRSASE